MKDVDMEPLNLQHISDKEKQELIAADAESTISGTTLGPPELEFQPVRTLHVSARGIPVLRLPTPTSELQIDIYDDEGNVAYKSTRTRKCSGNSVLSDSLGRELIATEYFFGPNRDPVLHMLGSGKEKVLTISKWTSRTQTFLLPNGRKFTWEYKKGSDFGAQGKKGTGLVMTSQGKRIAMLIRNDETRTPGSKSCSAGNGGALILGEDVGAKEGVSEELVVATCLLMLKKEVDRRRALQFAGLAAIIT
jgi:hypothetical protein